MRLCAGIDVGSTYTKAVLLDGDDTIVAKAMRPTGFRLEKIAEAVFDEARVAAGVERWEVDYVIATGYGRHRVTFKNLHVTDLTAAARGSRLLFPGTMGVLDIGGQTMKACRLEKDGKVKSFRLNDKCAAGTGAFLEKTARYMGFETKEIGALLSTSKAPVPISGVCAVFAESEVINHLSLGTPPADIMQGALNSLTTRAIQLIKRVKAEPQYTIIGGLLRFERLKPTIEERLGTEVNVSEADLPQYTAALGAAVLGHRRLEILSKREASAGASEG